MNHHLSSSALFPNTSPLCPPPLQSRPNAAATDCSQWLESLATLRQTLDRSQEQPAALSTLRASYISRKIKALSPAVVGASCVPATLSNLHERTSLMIEKSLLKVCVLS